MKPNQFPDQHNQPQRGAEQAPAPLSDDELKALQLRLQQRLRQANADPTGGHALKPGEVLPAGYQDTDGNNQHVVGRFIGFKANDRGEQVPVFQRHVAERPTSPAPQSPPPVQNQYSQPQAVPRPQPPQPGNQYPYPQGQYPQQPYQGQNQYPQPRPVRQYPQPPLYPGQQAPQPVAPPRPQYPSQPTQAYDVAASWVEPVTPDQVPPGVQFGPTPDAETIGFGGYQSYFEGGRGVNMGEFTGPETHVEAVNGVIGQKGEYGDDRFAPPGFHEDDLAAERARVAAEEAARQARVQKPDQKQ